MVRRTVRLPVHLALALLPGLLTQAACGGEDARPPGGAAGGAPAAELRPTRAGPIDSADARPSSEEAPGTSSAPSLIIFAFDRSPSVPDHQLTEAARLSAERVRSLGSGDRVVAMEVLQRSLEEPPRRWSQEIPGPPEEEGSPRDSAARATLLRDIGIYLASFADTAGRSGIAGTDLLSTLHDVGDELRVRSGRPVLYLFSDMLQSDPEIDMEVARRVPGPGWAEAGARAGTLPDLEGVCVMVVGGRLDTDHGQRVKRFWQAYFRAAGARLPDRSYSFRPPRLPLDPCAEEHGGEPPPEPGAEPSREAGP